jgi:hypothetical protein
MKKKERNFFSRSVSEQQLLIENTWCDQFGEADLGLIDPVEYEEHLKIYIEGKCPKCGTRVVSEITEFQFKGNLE